MLATIPVTKTTASRLTPELRDNAAFGAVFSDHMLVADYAGGKWGEPKILPYGAQPLAAAPAVAHYGQGIFEGFKAFPRPRGGAVLFRPDANHARMARTCQRMAMPEVPASIFVDGTIALVQLDRNWIPEKDNSALYVRPVMFATGETLGVKPSETFRFVIETCPSGPYFSGAADLIAEDTYVRAFPGGTGAAKCGGNYAGSMLAPPVCLTYPTDPSLAYPRRAILPLDLLPCRSSLPEVLRVWGGCFAMRRRDVPMNRHE